jgi:hypothetical protein
MLTILLFVAVLFKVFHVENLYFYTYIAFALVSRLTIAIRIYSLEALRSGSVYRGYSKARTAGDSVYQTLLIRGRKDLSSVKRSRHI